LLDNFSVSCNCWQCLEGETVISKKVIERAEKIQKNGALNLAIYVHGVRMVNNLFFH